MDIDIVDSPKMKRNIRVKYYMKRYINTVFMGGVLLVFTYFVVKISCTTHSASRTTSEPPMMLMLRDAAPPAAPSPTTTTTTPTNDNLILTSNVFNNIHLRNQMLRKKVEKLKKKFQTPRAVPVSDRTTIAPNYRVHIFYYAWYGNPTHDVSYKHWNHSYIPNWKYEDYRVYPTGYHGPPVDIASNYYPARGCYSSADAATITAHVRQLRAAGVGVLALSWAPPNFPDSPDALMAQLFTAAHAHDVKIALHIEPYAARHPANLRMYLKDFLERYGAHPALYRTRKANGDKELPVFYVYDSYLIPDYSWRDILSKKGKMTVRQTDIDGIFIGLLVDLSHRTHIKKSHFDGFYTYFAANSFSYGSTWKNWKGLAKYAKQNGLLFVPSVGPGYIDTNIRPWNTQNVRHRRHGQYYDVAWRTALSAETPFISVTSYNEWHEGTQIEPALSKHNGEFAYLDYEPEGDMFYMNLTQFWVEQYEKALKSGGYHEQ